jgi:hypothetical protein
MKRSFSILALVAAILATAIGCAQKPKETSVPKEVLEQRRRVKERVAFDIDRFRDHELAAAAMGDIQEIGGPAIPQLIDALNHETFEVRLAAFLCLNSIARAEYGFQDEFEYNAEWPARQRKGAQRRIAAWWDRTAGTVPDLPAAPKGREQ